MATATKPQAPGVAVADAPKHTPGPWITGNHWPVGWIMAEGVEKGPMHVADIRGWGYLTGRGHGALGLSHEDAAAIQDANGRLIAAAPELLDAARLALQIAESTIRSEFDGTSMVDGLLAQLGPVRAAIAKALGQSPTPQTDGDA